METAEEIERRLEMIVKYHLPIYSAEVKHIDCDQNMVGPWFNGDVYVEKEVYGKCDMWLNRDVYVKKEVYGKFDVWLNRSGCTIENIKLEIGRCISTKFLNSHYIIEDQDRCKKLTEEWSRVLSKRVIINDTIIDFMNRFIDNNVKEIPCGNTLRYGYGICNRNMKVDFVYCNGIFKCSLCAIVEADDVD
jgi:hypothetical protein